jgi:hypothetical protein
MYQGGFLSIYDADSIDAAGLTNLMMNCDRHNYKRVLKLNGQEISVYTYYWDKITDSLGDQCNACLLTNKTEIVKSGELEKYLIDVWQVWT